MSNQMSSSFRLIPAAMIIVFCCFEILLTVPCQGASIMRTGGLVSYPGPIIGENLLKNTGFKEIDPKTGTPVGWKLSKAFAVVTASSNEINILQLKDAPVFPYAESAMQKIYLRKGSYRFGGRVKTDLTDSKRKGVRYSIVGAGTTQLSCGTTDWHTLQAQKIYIKEDGNYLFKVESYSEPAGTAWFDGMFVMRESMPLEVFLKYPNYRGMLFDDQAQVILISGSVDLAPGSRQADYQVSISVFDEGSNQFVYTKVLPVSALFEIEINGSGFKTGNSYLISVCLKNHESDELAYEYPSYRIVKVPASVRREMTVSFDEHNRFLVKDKPTFWLGVYDSGMGYPATERQWEKLLRERRRLFELPINLYLNYWYGQASLPAMQTMMNVLQNKGIYYLQTGNAFNATYKPNFFAIDKDRDFLESISRHPGLAGFYTADEAKSSLVPTMFGQYRRLKSVKTDGMTFATLLNPKSLHYWRDTVDVISMDPYPLAGTEPQNGYNLALVADWTRATKEAVMDSRPFMTVLQYFKHTSKGRWPNREELRNMSYMAIVEGANGLMYWSLGAKALANVCKDWCEERVRHFETLKSVMYEIDSLKSVLAEIDRPDLLHRNSNKAAIKTRVKYKDGKTYIIAYNYKNEAVFTYFTMKHQLREIRVYKEGRKIISNGLTFSDSFGPFQARVYEITLK
jgi:hypothetical protein